MSADVLGRQSAAFGGAYDSDRARLTVTGTGLGGLFVESVQANYQQQVNRVYDMTDRSIFYIKGQAQGQGNIGSLIGPKAGADAAIAALADICKPVSLSFDLAGAGCGTAGGVGMGRTLKEATLMSVGMQGQAQDMLIRESLGFIFGSMTMKGASGAGAAA